MAPGIAILSAFPTKDMFTEFNKYPEQMQRVSTLQYQHQQPASDPLAEYSQDRLHHQGSQRPTSPSNQTDLLGIKVNRQTNQVDFDLLMANKVIEDDDEELIDRYRMSGVNYDAIED